MHSRRWLLVLMLGGLLPLSTAWACNVPVFRYALERWRPDAYEAVVFHRGPLSLEQEAIVKELQGAEHANLRTHAVDLAGEVGPAARKLWETEKDAALPWLVVRYPEHAEVKAALWKGPLQRDVVKALLQSPARRELAGRLMKKDSAVWLLLESGAKAKDDAAAKLLQTELARLEKSLKLPFDPGELETDPKAAKDNQLLSPMPLKVSFSVLRVSRTDPAERLFVAMLLEAIEDPEQAKEKGSEPVLFPIFGRGRALVALVGEQIEADAISDLAAFLCGACSCNVKAFNPGMDLLFAADWDSVLGEGPSVVAEPPVQPGKPVEIPQPSVKLAATVPAAQPLPAPPEQPLANLAVLIAGIAVLAALGGLLFLGGIRRKVASCRSRF